MLLPTPKHALVIPLYFDDTCPACNWDVCVVSCGARSWSPEISLLLLVKYISSEAEFLLCLVWRNISILLYGISQVCYDICVNLDASKENLFLNIFIMVMEEDRSFRHWRKP